MAENVFPQGYTLISVLALWWCKLVAFRAVNMDYVLGSLFHDGWLMPLPRLLLSIIRF